MLADRPDGRRLSAEEQRQLDDLEARLSQPAAPPRAVPAGLGAARRAAARGVLPPLLAVAATLLVLAAVVGGVGGLLAVAAALAATVGVLLVRRRLLRAGPPLPRPHRAGTP